MNYDDIITKIKQVNESFKRSIIKLDMINITLKEADKNNQEIIKLLPKGGFNV